MKKLAYITLLVVAVLAIDIALVSFHHHENGVIKDDCPLCRFQDTGFTAGVQNPECALITPDSVCVYVPLAHEAVLFRHHALHSARPNAPPFMA